MGSFFKLHYEELHNLNSSPSIIRMIKLRSMRWARHIARMEAKRNVRMILVEKPEGTGPQDVGGRIINLKMDLREVGWGGMDWIDVLEGRDQWKALMNTVMKLQAT
jgi:hypothetical protein